MAIIRPLYKNGDLGNVDSYRPISILPSLAKLLEKHLFLIMTASLDKIYIMSLQQYGFITGKGTLLLEDFSDLLPSALKHNLFRCALFWTCLRLSTPCLIKLF